MTTVALIDYGAGNIRSASRALAKASADANLGMTVTVTADPDAIRAADRIVLPGVGHYADCREGLTARAGVVEAMTEAVLDKGRPFLGICVGMQLLADKGLEDGETPGLGWIGGVVDRIRPDDPHLPVPHMGWNEIEIGDHPVLAGLGPSPHVYFTHSYVFEAADEADVAARFAYGGAFTAAVARATIFGCQFHPEKSQATGLKILSNFLSWAP